MKKTLLIILTIITFILLIIQKDTNLFLAFPLLFIPLIINYLFQKKEGIEIINYNLVIMIFYLTITIIYYFVTYEFLSTIILLLLMLIYYFYNPKLKIEEKYLYANKVLLTKKIKIPSLVANNYKKAKIEIASDIKEDEEVLRATNTRDLIQYYHEIELNRARYENLVRSKKMQIISSFIIPLIIVFIFIFKIPNPLNNTNLLIIYFLLSTTNIFLSVYLPSEQDIMLRPPRIKGERLFSKEEKLFNVVNIFSFIAAITIPYMFILYITDQTNIINYVFIISFIITNFVNISYHLNDNPTLINIIKLLQNKIYLLIIIISISSFVIIHQLYDKYNTFNGTNYLKLIIIILVMICWEDIIKLARYLKNRKKAK